MMTYRLPYAIQFIIRKNRVFKRFYVFTQTCFSDIRRHFGFDGAVSHKVHNRVYRRFS